MTNQTLADKTAATTLADTDIIYLLRDPSGTPADRKITVANFRASLLPLPALQSVWVPAAAMIPTFTNGCAALANVQTTSGRPDLNTLDFDKDTIEYAQFAISLPKGWNEGTITAQFYWSHAATTTNFKVAFDIQGVAVSDDDTVDVVYGTAQQANDTGGTTSDLYVSPATSAITIAGTPAAGDLIYFRVSRVATDATNDTLAIDARLHGVKLFYSIDTLDDA